MTLCIFQVGIYLLKVSNENTKTMDKTCSKLSIEIPKRRHSRHSDGIIVNFEHSLHIGIVFSLLTLNKQTQGGNIH